MAENWREKLDELKQIILSTPLNSADDAENFRIKFLSTKGKIREAMGLITSIGNDAKKDFGQVINEIKSTAEVKWKSAIEKTKKVESSTIDIDLTAPMYSGQIGSNHPITIVRNKMISIFGKIGFEVYEGPEIEDDWHNFTALNTPLDHPARDMQDTFFITEDKEYLLRTHSSSSQIRALENEELPLRIITPGRVYRNETISARAHCTFHQMEGLFVDTDVSFADLKQCIYYFAKNMFGSDTIRFRPSFFPFTEPSAEVDIPCFICNQKGCNVCKKTGWVEIGGCGMVDPQVLINCNIDSEKYNGFAFGMGIERIAMLLYRIDDIRLFWQNDSRFLNQFS